jgi:hypothetical protein
LRLSHIGCADVGGIAAVMNGLRALSPPVALPQLVEHVMQSCCEISHLRCIKVGFGQVASYFVLDPHGFLGNWLEDVHLWPPTHR